MRPQPLTRAEKIRRNRLDAEIANAFPSGVSISVLDIPEVYKAGYAARAAGQDVAAAVRAAAERLRKD